MYFPPKNGHVFPLSIQGKEKLCATYGGGAFTPVQMHNLFRTLRALQPVPVCRLGVGDHCPVEFKAGCSEMIFHQALQNQDLLTFMLAVA